MKNPQIPYFEIEKIIILMILVLPFVCSGQIEKVGYSMYIDYKDIIVRKGLVYSKADTILVTGRVIQYNRKKEGKRYIEVVNGKPKSNDWISFQEKLVQPQASLLGEIVTVVAVGTGIVMAVTGNDVNVPIGENFNPKLKEFYKDIGIYDEYKFSGNPNIIPKPFIVEASNERTYEEVNYTIKLKKKRK